MKMKVWLLLFIVKEHTSPYCNHLVNLKIQFHCDMLISFLTFDKNENHTCSDDIVIWTFRIENYNLSYETVIEMVLSLSAWYLRIWWSNKEKRLLLCCACGLHCLFTDTVPCFSINHGPVKIKGYKSNALTTAGSFYRYMYEEEMSHF